LQDLSDRPVIVAIPVKDEEGRIDACLQALARQTVPIAKILLLLNNCTDGTAAIAHEAAGRIPGLRVVEVELEAGLASAGEARRVALQQAVRLAGEHGVIVTTDADCVPKRDWIAKNLRDINHGADVVCGIASVGGEDDATIPTRLHFDLVRESLYAALIDEILALVDPDPADPWPRHQHDSGASIAMTAAILRKAGGAPHVPHGEDRALIQRFRTVDAKIRHAPDIEVQVSGRLEGRAKGGMAEALRRRAHRLDELTDAAFEPAVDAYRRALARARLRAIRRGGQGGAALAEDLLVHPARLAAALQAKHFGAAWEIVQRMSPVLQRRRVKFAGLAGETRQAMALRDQLVRDSLAEQARAGYRGLHAG
jgi:glycosyltransferase involved in cell wall biosynthesis